MSLAPLKMIGDKGKERSEHAVKEVALGVMILNHGGELVMKASDLSEVELGFKGVEMRLIQSEHTEPMIVFTLIPKQESLIIQ